MISNLIFLLLIILFVVYVLKKNMKRRSDEYKKLDETPFMESLNPEEKQSSFQDEFEKNKSFNNLNNIDAP